MSLPRRSLLQGVGASLLAAALSGCNRITEDPRIVKALSSAEDVNRGVQRLFGRKALAREFTKADISAFFKPNGSTDPQDTDYKAHAAAGFADWTLIVDGLVDHPLTLSLA